MLTIIERARLYVAKCPPAISGQRGHDATFHVAAVLWNGFGLSEAETLTVLAEWNRACQPPWSEAELIHKVRSVANAQHSDPRGYLVGETGPEAPGAGRRDAYPTLPPPPPKPAFSPEVLKRVAAKAASVADVVAFVMERSPVAPGSQDPASVLRRLYAFGSGEKVLVFSKMDSPGQMLWEANRSDVIQAGHLPSGPDGVWFLPQPVDGEWQPNPRLGGKFSRRSEESVTAWRFAVLESDEADADDWLRCLVQMPLRIASICESGGRSIHALVRVDAASKAEWDKWMGGIKVALITLGADRGALSAVRLTRLPQAQRGERVQRLLYLNPSPDGTPILDQPARSAGYPQGGNE
ncbi:MAG TPA: hypothetical protein PKI20_07195 [Verrucomicrobiota bacterium]|nr:hypothetical protein [Verrucomicrobiota bacterium]HQL77657.1 hypothetical protein [Verrucomicrobiota bacterium]